MTIWILTIVLLASLAGLGYRQGVVRVAFSLVGILIGAALAAPLGHLIRPVFSAIGLKHPVLAWLLPPFVMFCLVLILFKIAGFAADRKVDVYHKYRAGELRYSLWERLSRRAGLSLGMVNGLAYLVLLSFVIHAFSYWTVQLAAAESASSAVKILNRLGKDLEGTGMARVGRTVDGLPDAYYDAADVCGTLYHNYSPRLATRLSCYPAILGVGERPEFQELGSDADFAGLWQKQGSLVDLIKNPKAAAALKNPELMKSLWAAAKPNLQDLHVFLRTGESTNYTERILGRWAFDVNASMAMLRRSKPNLTPTVMLQQRNWTAAKLGKASFVATPDQQIFLKNVLAPGVPPTAPTQTFMGHWKSVGTKYELTLEGGNQSLTPEFQGDRVSLTLGTIGYVFAREN